MDPKSAESGTEFVLDNRRLILGFLLLIVICGGFFVIGFVEGKRQVTQTATHGLAPVSPTTAAGSPAAPGTAASAMPSKSAQSEDRSVRDQLDWYKNVQSSAKDVGKGLDAAVGTNATPLAPKRTPSAQSPSVKSANPGSAASAAKNVYAVQVGAFKQKHEAESTMQALSAKGYACSIELPKTADDLYLVKVGKFNSRADAVAMQRRLQKDGFRCFVKSY